MSNNQKIAWDNSYRLGIKKIDQQHKKLFELVNRLYDLEEGVNTKEELRVILYEFSDYVKVHFQDEEDYMTSIAFPDLKNHKLLHEHLVDSLSKIIQTPAKLDIIKTKMRVLAKRVLIDHILQEDTKIKLYALQNCDEEIFDISDIE
ncbi:MAG: hemerythrin family protein [Sulfurimonas sp.]|nr:hemerythrin family protein [Sulfurimonas sp.]MDD3060361.1 hemerythrin family protein [Sulfurimonas sp.]